MPETQASAASASQAPFIFLIPISDQFLAAGSLNTQVGRCGQDGDAEFVSTPVPQAIVATPCGIHVHAEGSADAAVAGEGGRRQAEVAAAVVLERGRRHAGLLVAARTRLAAAATLMALD